MVALISMGHPDGPGQTFEIHRSLDLLDVEEFTVLSIEQRATEYPCRCTRVWAQVAKETLAVSLGLMLAMTLMCGRTLITYNMPHRRWFILTLVSILSIEKSDRRAWQACIVNTHPCNLSNILGGRGRETPRTNPPTKRCLGGS